MKSTFYFRNILSILVYKYFVNGDHDLKNQRPILEMVFGSHLYGTSTPNSDRDFKIVHLPAGRDIILQKVKPVINFTTKSSHTEKNGPNDVDHDSIALHKLLKMGSDGDTMAIEILFAPDWAIINKDPLWDEIRSVRNSLINKKCKGFVGYCQRQAAKYGVKGSRVAAVRESLNFAKEMANSLGKDAKLSEANALVAEMATRYEHCGMELIEQPYGVMLPHWVVCGRKIPFNSSFDNAVNILQRIFDNYGHRALQAETNQGVDWKAVSHAVRVARQAIELMSTGNLTFPRPDAEELTAIKLGQIHYATVAENLENLLAEVDRIGVSSFLPEESDSNMIEEIVLGSYLSQVE